MDPRAKPAPDTVTDTGLHPALEPFATGTMDVGDGHKIYYAQSGNPKGIPVVYLHGGPGAGAVPGQRRIFDPKVYHIVQFDQRGCGLSTPFASIEHNTTDHLVGDIERLREHLNIDRWLVAGGSWGVALALAYGTRHADRCLGFILRGVFLGTDPEVQWFLHGMQKMFPEAHADFAQAVGGLHGDDLFQAYLERLFDPDPNRHLPAARAWAHYETRCSTLYPNGGGFGEGKAFDAYALSLSRIEAHYFKHHCFLEPDELMSRLDAVRHLPAIIVQGRYDIICPFATAHKLHLAWPNSELEVALDAGHSGMEPAISRALVLAAQRMAHTLDPSSGKAD